MKKNTNIVSIVIFVISAFFAIYYGWNNDKVMTVVFLAILVGISVVRVVLLSRATQIEKKQYVPIRNVHVQDTKFIDSESFKDSLNSTEYSSKENDTLLIHVDDVNKEKTIIKVFKDYTKVEDSTKLINE